MHLLCLYLFQLISCCGFWTSTLTERGGDGKNEKIISTFNVQSHGISQEGLINWTTNNEHGSLVFVVEQYIYDKWVAVGEVNGIGTPNPNSYSVAVTLHTGENKFRVQQKGYDQMSRFSDTFTYYSKKEPISYRILNKNQTIGFSGDTYFIVYNPFGVIVKQGYGNSIDISDYQKGYYCLVYDNKLGGFEKKKVILKHSPFPIIIERPRWVQKMLHLFSF